MRLLLVRHGATLYNEEKRYTGQSDVPLTDLGEQQAAALGKRLASEKLDVIVSSDLQRARLTAQAIASYHALPVWEDSDLRETALGTWEGLTFAEVRALDAGLVARRLTDPTYAPPGGETVIQVHDRVARALARWQRQYPDSTMLWVTHAGAISVLICHLLGIDLNHRHQFRHYNASITETDLSRDHAILVHLNDTAHLRPLTEKGSS